MPNINQMKDHNYLKKEDCGDRGLLLTIESVEEQNIAGEGRKPDIKWVLNFKEDAKPLILNWTRMQDTATATGSQESENWPGKKIVVYNDPSVMYGGEKVGGTAVRAPKSGAAPAPKPAPAPTTEPDEDDIPF